MESTQLHHHPQSHGIHNSKKKKKPAKLTCDLHQSTSSVRPNSMTTIDLNGNDLGGEKSREREREWRKKEKKKKEEVKILEKKE